MISEVDFISGCPVGGCKNNKTSYRWRHFICGGHERITNQGKIKCLECGTNGLFIDWNFNCGAHDFKEASQQGFLSALSVLSELVTKDQKFLSLLSRNVSEQFLNA